MLKLNVSMTLSSLVQIEIIFFCHLNYRSIFFFIFHYIICIVRVRQQTDTRSFLFLYYRFNIFCTMWKCLLNACILGSFRLVRYFTVVSHRIKPTFDKNQLFNWDKKAKTNEKHHKRMLALICCWIEYLLIKGLTRA